MGATSIYNGKGGLPGGGKNRWMNKITVTVLQDVARLRSHKVRTDADFLGSTAGEFMALIQAIVDALEQ